MPEALSALVSQYLETAVAVEQNDVEDFFSYFVPKSRVRDAIGAMLSAREFSFTTVGGKTMLHITPRKQPAPLRRGKPIARRPATPPKA